MELQQQLDQANQTIKQLSAQLEAAKQMVNEGLAASLQLRTNLSLLSQAYYELQQKNTPAPVPPPQEATPAE